ncbi:MAG: cysteine--tRNA ligase [Erysipelotrichaceae bacterium]|nr:cysteine--tRNA ligase [Erysipelotrichaceae bacterium]MDY5252979.1 cysteine--tRNA ligase [Erysipelotrichaceae bacterium]
MKLYNSKSLKIEEFKPIKANEVSMYVCGPTVYNHAHIGNARPIIVFDTLRRLFEKEGYKVKYVSNYTDVDDKIIKKANEEGVSEEVIAKRYIDAYEKVRASLNTIPLDATPQVTQTMDDIIHFIDELVKSNHAYVVDGDVYFRVSSIENYGQISNQKIEDLQAGARIEENDKKESPFDFALWKKTDMGIKWDSPWSCGRPGWHTECVVMINKEFNGMIDIHGGGMDLKFPHHENEAAQNEALHHHGIANYWIHNAMININGAKMSKSLGNVSWAKDVIAKLDAPLVRWLMNSVHYRKELNFSDETIETARKELDKVFNALKQADIKRQLSDTALIKEYDEAALRKFLDEMDDDLNTPNAYAQIFESVKQLNNSMRKKDIDMVAMMKIYNSILEMLEVLGVAYTPVMLDEQDKALFASWNEAKQQKDFAQADVFRQKLMDKGLI